MSNWHRDKNPAVFLPGLNVGNVLRGLIRNLLKSTAKAPLLSRGLDDEFMLERKSQETSSTDKQAGEHEMISKSVSVSLLSNGLIKGVFTNVSQ